MHGDTAAKTIVLPILDDGIYEGSETFEVGLSGSALGSSLGALVTITFGLFTSVGGPKTAIATLALGMVAYLGALVAEMPLPFLTSLAVALATYGIGAALEASRQPEVKAVELDRRWTSRRGHPR